MQRKIVKRVGFSSMVAMLLGISAYAFPVEAISVDQNQDSFVLSDEAPGYAISELVNAGKSKSAKYQKGDTVFDLGSSAGFEVNILSEDKEISETQYNGLPPESVKIEALKR